MQIFFKNQRETSINFSLGFSSDLLKNETILLLWKRIYPDNYLTIKK